jgi:hypothetical protein
MHSCNTTRPGCGGFFIVMGWFLLVVIDIINILRPAVKAKYHAPVCPDSYGPEAFHLASERMQAKPRQIHLSDGWGSVKRRQNVSQLTRVFRVYAAGLILFEKALQSFMANVAYHLVP